MIHIIDQNKDALYESVLISFASLISVCLSVSFVVSDFVVPPPVFVFDANNISSGSYNSDPFEFTEDIFCRNT